MSLPHVLKRFNVRGNGNNYLGMFEEIEFPKIKKKIEDYRGNGMMAPVPIDLGYEVLECSITAGGLVLPELRRAGKVGVDNAQLTLVGAYQRDDTCEVVAAEMVMRGMLVELDPGSGKEGDKNKIKLSYKLSYLKWVVNGETVIEIDALTTLETDLKAALGL
jgi:hypothetical protein